MNSVNDAALINTAESPTAVVIQEDNGKDSESIKSQENIAIQENIESQENIRSQLITVLSHMFTRANFDSNLYLKEHYISATQTIPISAVLQVKKSILYYMYK